MKQWIAVIVFYSTISAAESPTQFVQRQNSPAVFGGMSINAVFAPDIVDYINSLSTYSQQVSNFTTVVDFFGGIEFPISDEWGIKLEHTYLFKSYNFLGSTGGTYDFFYSTQSPSVLIQKVITGEGYFVKFGAGGGYHFGSATQTISTYGTSNQYAVNGVGLKAEMVGQTAFDENFYGYISGHLGWEFLGTLKDTSTKNSLTIPNDISHSISLRYFFAGIRFGVIIYL